MSSTPNWMSEGKYSPQLSKCMCYVQQCLSEVPMNINDSHTLDRLCVSSWKTVQRLQLNYTQQNKLNYVQQCPIAAMSHKVQSKCNMIHMSIWNTCHTYSRHVQLAHKAHCHTHMSVRHGALLGFTRSCLNSSDVSRTLCGMLEGYKHSPQTGLTCVHLINALYISCDVIVTFWAWSVPITQ